MTVRVGVWEDVSREAPQEGQKRLSSGVWREQEEQRGIGGDGSTLPVNKEEAAPGAKCRALAVSCGSLQRAGRLETDPPGRNIEPP